MSVSDAKRLKQLEHDNTKLKKLLAEAMLDNAVLKDTRRESHDARHPAYYRIGCTGGARPQRAADMFESGPVRPSGRGETRAVGHGSHLHLPIGRRASVHTRGAYAYSFQPLVTFAAQRLHTRPCRLRIEDLDVMMILAFRQHVVWQDASSSSRTQKLFGPGLNHGANPAANAEACNAWSRRHDATSGTHAVAELQNSKLITTRARDNESFRRQNSHFKQ